MQHASTGVMLHAVRLSMSNARTISQGTGGRIHVHYITLHAVTSVAWFHLHVLNGSQENKTIENVTVKDKLVILN